MFKGFFLGGFEGAAGRNRQGTWFDGISSTHHDRLMNEDYSLLKTFNISTVRECVRWPLVNRGRTFDFSTLDVLIESGRRAGFTTIYDLFHFGYPDSIDLLSEEFPKRFAEYCFQVARRVHRQTEGECYFTPINEPSYLAWAGGDVGLFPPYLKNTGFDLKVALVRAAICGTEAIWAACPNARIVSVDPFYRVAPDSLDPHAIARADTFNASVVFQSWDMLAGRFMPELGGSLKHLDIVGINYYWTNQWILDEPWAPLNTQDVRRMPLRYIARTVWKRYGQEILLSETSHVGEMRAQWMKELVSEIEAIRALKIPLLGVCWYPVLEMADWHMPSLWTPMGLWDLDHAGGSMRRTAYKPVLNALRAAQERLETTSLDTQRLIA